MIQLRTVFLAGLVLGVCSCRTMGPVASAEVSRVSAAAQAAMPDTIKAQQVLVFGFKPHWWWPTIRMTALGYAAVNRTVGDYAVVCVSPMGVKLFEAKRQSGVASVVMAFPVKGNAEAMGQAIGEDIESLYFGLIPPPNAVWRQGGQVLIATVEAGASREEWRFDAASGRLLKKTMWTAGGARTVAFDEYRQAAGNWYPARMSLENRRFGYTLKVQQNQP